MSISNGCGRGSRRTSTARPVASSRASLISGGRSNLTYSVGDDAHEWVLRRPPLGHVLPTAHDMAREYTVLAALAPTEVPVPVTRAFCERRRGERRALLRDGEGRRAHPAHAADLAALSHDDARRCSEELIDVLVAIHAVDYAAVGLGDFGHPDGYVERQVRRWGEQWERSKTRELPADRRARAPAARRAPALAAADDRARRLPPRQHDARPRRPRPDRRGARLGDGDARRSARRPRAVPRSTTAATTRRPATCGATISPEAGFLSRDEVVERYATHRVAT